MTLIEDTDNWQAAFFVLVLASVVAINVNGAIFQGGLLGLVGKFPPQYIGGTLTGQGLPLPQHFSIDLSDPPKSIIQEYICKVLVLEIRFGFTKLRKNCGSALVSRWHFRQRNQRHLHRGRRRRCARRFLLLLHRHHFPRLGTRRIPICDQGCI